MRYFSLPLLVFSSLLLTGCLEDKCEQTVTYYAYDAVTITAAEWRGATFTQSPPIELCQPSGFYVYGDYLFTVDRNQGLQIIDNADNNDPRPIAFLNIPGSQGIAVRNNVLYVSQYLDLLAFDLTDPREPTLLSRTEDVFTPGEVFVGTTQNAEQFVVEYVAREETTEVSCDNPRYGSGGFWMEDMFMVKFGSRADFSAVAQNSAPDVVGLGGSLARFTISNATLYAVDDYSLRTFSLAKADQPEFMGIVNLGWGIETIFPYKDQLYIGSTTGMHIFDASNPLSPEWLSTFQHVLSCDPVVVQNDLAYVTMWGGSSCGNMVDQLSVIDVSDPRNPKELQNTVMENSHGLGVSGDRLFLCAGSDGLRIFDLTDGGLLGPEVSRERNFNAKDIIVRPDRGELIVFGWEKSGIRQYDYVEGEGLTPASDLAICR